MTRRTLSAAPWRRAKITAVQLLAAGAELQFAVNSPDRVPGTRSLLLLLETCHWKSERNPRLRSRPLRKTPPPTAQSHRHCPGPEYHPGQLAGRLLETNPATQRHVPLPGTTPLGSAQWHH